MAVSSLRYRPNAPAPEENQFGYVVFSGSPSDYHHWLFRTQLKLKTAKDDEKVKTVQNIIENLYIGKMCSGSENDEEINQHLQGKDEEE